MTRSLALLLIWTSVAHAQPSPSQFIKAWNEATFTCSGDTRNEDLRADECARAAALRAHLNERGWCFGKQGQAQYQKQWHQCKAGSIRPNDLLPSQEP